MSASDPLLPCPGCATPVEASADASGNCRKCGVAWSARANVVTWSVTQAAPPVQLDFRQRLIRALTKGTLPRYAWSRLRQLVSPIASPLSPVPRILARKREEFYEATLTNRSLAQRWADHYLRGLDIPPGAEILDLGCGRGRNLALLSQLGYRVSGQEIFADAWWSRLRAERIQVVPPAMSHLPWPDASFDVLLTVQTIAFFDPPRLRELVAEARRVLRKGGVWLLVESNRRSYVAATMEKYYGRPPYIVETVKAVLQDGSFQTIDSWYEAFYSPVLAQTVNALRMVFTSGPADISDFGSRAERLIPAERRGLWVLRVRLGPGSR